MLTGIPIQFILIVPLLSGQPLLSGHFSNSRGWPRNTGRAVTVCSFKKKNIQQLL